MPRVPARSLLLTLLLSAALLGGCARWLHHAKVHSVTMAKLVGPKNEPNVPSLAFGGDDLIHCVVRMEDDPGGSKLLVRFMAVEAENTFAGAEIDRLEYVTHAGESEYYDFQLQSNDGSFGVGTYQANVYLDVAPPEPPTQSLLFQVDKAGPFARTFITRDPKAELALDTLTNPVPTLFANVWLFHPRAGMRVRARLITSRVAGFKPGTPLDESERVLANPNEETVHFAFSPDDGTMPLGHYAVEYYADGQAVPAKVVPFRVARPSPPPSP